jgi:hypothetical protein
MLLTCDSDTCKKEYRYPDGNVKALVLVNGPHSALPGGKDCTGILRSDTPLPTGELDWRAK